MATTATPPRGARNANPTRNRMEKVRNLHSIPTSEGARSARYMVIHDLLPTNTRLHRIRLVETEDCTLSGKDTTVQTPGMLGRRNMGMDPYTGGDQTERTRHAYPLAGYRGPLSAFGHVAKLWILASLVYYIVHNSRTISLEELSTSYAERGGRTIRRGGKQ